MSRHRLVLAGSGGQGIITAAIILAEAAVLMEGQNAIQSQSYGAAARGGISRSDVILSDQEIHFPKVTQPNTLICLTQQSYDSFFNIIRPGGILITDDSLVHIDKKAEARTFHLPLLSSVKEKLGMPVVLNICMLGALQALTELVRMDSLEGIVERRMPSKHLQVNKQALQLGSELGGQALFSTGAGQG